MSGRLLIVKAVLLLALVGCGQVALLFVPLRTEDDYLAASLDKETGLKAPGQYRLIMVGGSNCAFGIDSQILQEGTGRQTVNMGLHAGLGLYYMLREAMDGLRAGDLVVLAPEYEEFYGDLAYGQRELADIVAFNPSAIRYITSPRQWMEIARNAGQSNWGKLFSRIQLLRGRVPRSGSVIYRRRSFDNSGDMIAHLNRSSPGFSQPTGPPGDSLNPAAFRIVRKFRENLSHRGIGLIIIFPPVSRSYWAVNRGAAKTVAAALVGLPVLSRPEDWVFNDDLFFDTAYHLNGSGRKLRSLALVRLLKGWSTISVNSASGHSLSRY